MLSKLTVPNRTASHFRASSAGSARKLCRWRNRSWREGIHLCGRPRGAPAGVVASKTTLPVIGIPMPGQLAGGLDALLSIVQMPKGVPVATVGIGQAENAALLAAQMLSLSNDSIAQMVKDQRAEARRQIEDDPTNRSA